MTNEDDIELKVCKKCDVPFNSNTARIAGKKVREVKLSIQLRYEKN